MSPLVNDAFMTLRPYRPGKSVAETAREFGAMDRLKLASNENPYGPSPKAIDAMQRALAGLADYPDGNGFALKGGLAKMLGIAADQIILGNGTNEIIEMVVRTFLREDESLLFADPSFVAYLLAAQAMGRPVITVPLTPDLRFDTVALLAAVTPATKILFVANPNNPTGTYLTRRELRLFLTEIPAHVLVVIDEAYFEYATVDDYPNSLDFLGIRQRLLIMRTFSKCYGLAGARIGYGVGDATLIDYLNRGRQPFNVNSLGQVGALAALGDVEHVAMSRRYNSLEKERLIPELRKRGLRVYPSQANFLLVDFQRAATSVFHDLLRQGVIVRPMDTYGLPTHQRITIGTPAQNSRLLVAIDAIAAP